MVCQSQSPRFVVDNDRGGAAHLQHGINRVVIFDIDLHHGDFIGIMFSLSNQISLTCTWQFVGNGTQSIAWQINEETYRLTLESEHDKEAGSQKPGLKIYYSSLHDILSYPCEVRQLMVRFGQCHSI